MAKNKPGFYNILEKHEHDVLEEWLQEQLAAVTLRKDLLNEAELREQSRKFLSSFIAACRSGNLTDITGTEWAEVRALLASVSRSRAADMFSPSETATFIFSLKQPVFACIRKELESNIALVPDEIWGATVLLDKLGLYTTEIYQETREEIINRQLTEIREGKILLVQKEKLAELEKLAIMGKISGSIGHELRNPLGAIKNAAYFLDMALEKPDPDVKEMVKLISKEVARSENIINSLLDFARPKTLTLRKEPVNPVINEALKRYPVPNTIAVISNLDETLPKIMADQDKLLQVFINLISNAFQAMPEGGNLTITSKQSGPRWVSISFADTGGGISAENMKKIYEPLFTTKIKGIGLGLPVTRTIVESHGGHIDVQSEEGKGTTVTVNLPMSGRKEE